MTATSTSSPLDGDVRSARVRDVRCGTTGVAACPRPDAGRPRARPRRDLAGPDVRDAVDLGEAVAAVAGQAQRPAATRQLARPEDRERDRVARLERERPSVDDDPAAAGAVGAPTRDLGHWRIRRPCGSKSGSRLEPGRPPAADDLDLEAVAARPVRRRERGRHVAERDRLPDVVAVAARRDPADDLAVVPDRLVADDVGRVVRIGLDDERDEAPLRAAAPPARASCAARPMNSWSSLM